MSSPNPTAKADNAERQRESAQPHRGITPIGRLQSANQITISSHLNVTVIVSIGS